MKFKKSKIKKAVNKVLCRSFYMLFLWISPKVESIVALFNIKELLNGYETQFVNTHSFKNME